MGICRQVKAVFEWEGLLSGKIKTWKTVTQRVNTLESVTPFAILCNEGF